MAGIYERPNYDARDSAILTTKANAVAAAQGEQSNNFQHDAFASSCSRQAT